MANDSPAAIIFSSDGYEATVKNAATIKAGTPSLISAGSDGTNSRYITVDSSGRQVVVGAGTAGSPVGGVLTVQGISGGQALPISGTVTSNIGTTNGLALDATLAKLTISPGTSLGSNTLAMIGGSVTTSAPSYTTGQINALSLTTSGLLRVDGSGVTQPISGSVTISSGSIVVTQSTAANFNATIVGTGSDNTTNSTSKVPVLPARANSSAPTWTDGYMVPLSVDTSGNLRVAGTFTASAASDTTSSGNLNALNATVQVAVTGQHNAGMQLSAGTLVGTIVPEISMDGGTTWVTTFFDDPTTGNIVSSITFAANNTATTRTIVGAGGSSHARVRVSSYTSGTAACALRSSFMKDHSLLTNGAAASALPPLIMQAGGSVSTSAPTYTNGTLNALSLTTTGLLRVETSSSSVSTATLSNVASSITSVTLLAANTNRKSVVIVNDSTQVLYVKFGSAASSTSYTYRLISNATLELPQPIYTGIITGVWVSANGGTARVTEMSP